LKVFAAEAIFLLRWLCRRPYIPDEGGSISAPGIEESAVRRECETCNRTLMPLQLFDFFLFSEIKHMNSRTFTGERTPPAVGGKGDAPYGPEPLAVDTSLLSRGQLPQARGIAGRGKKAATIRRECHGSTVRRRIANDETPQFFTHNR